MNSTVNEEVFGILLAGGSGTRLWPLSQPNMPKHLISLEGEASLLQKTAKRIGKIVSPNRVVTVTIQEQSDLVRQQLSEIDRNFLESFFVEPCGRNTLPAISCATMKIYDMNPESIVCVCPTDHYVGNEDAFQEVMAAAILLAEHQHIVVIGVEPTYAESGYGYIKRGDKLEPSSGYKVAAFIEKPNKELAGTLLSQGDHFWNAGIFIFKASVFLSELLRLQPLLYKMAQEIQLAERNGNNQVIESRYRECPSISIDKAIMEKTDKGAMVSSEMDWSDMGSWHCFYQQMSKTQEFNAIQGQVIARDTHSSLLLSDGGVVAIIGLSDVAVVKTDTAVLVSKLDRTQEVKDIVKQLHEAGVTNASKQQEIKKPWGSYVTLEVGQGYKLKKIIIRPKQRLSLQRHRHRAEHWIVVHGKAQVTNGNEELHLKVNEGTFIPVGHKHRLSNPGDEDLKIIEVQIGSQLDEDDIERLEDDYGRA